VTEGLKACTILLREADEIFDMRLNNLLFFDSFFSSLLPSVVSVASEVSLMDRGRSTSLPLRLDAERLLMKESRREALAESLWCSVLDEDMDILEAHLRVGGFKGDKLRLGASSLG